MCFSYSDRANKLPEGQCQGVDICQGVGSVRPVYRVLSIETDPAPGLVEPTVYLKRVRYADVFSPMFSLLERGTVHTDKGV